MASIDMSPFFSIIISTRDRPEVFRTALLSVTTQTYADQESIGVVDGSSEENMKAYSELGKQLKDIAFYELDHRENGHGQSYAMNHGAHQSSGKFLCFLDDDDHWTDDHYLDSLHESLTASERPVDVHYSNQKAVFADGTPQTASVWIEDLIPNVRPEFNNINDSYFVDVGFLLSSDGFAHLNCSVFNRIFYNTIGKMDESIRYENDRDVFIRSIDAANVMLFSTRYISLHNIPDVKKKNNMSTVSSEIDKKLYQMRVYDKGISLGKQQQIVRFCCKAKVYELKHATNILANCSQYTSAAHYAKAALISGFNFRWLAYTLYLIGKSWLQPSDGSSQQHR